MSTALEKNVAVIYCVDEHDYRKKHCGLTLMDQLFLSIDSLRGNWSATVDVYVISTGPLSDASLARLGHYNVKALQGRGPLRPDFLLANKILVGEEYAGVKDILFLDCDTRFHRILTFDNTFDIVVAYDVVQPLSLQDYEEFYLSVGLQVPNGRLFANPAYEYYTHGTNTQFPQFNSGVFFLKHCQKMSFYDEWKRTFLNCYQRFRYKPWSFYLEQLSFTAAILKLNLNYSLFPPGVNFICTPRAPSLYTWPRSRIILEHYAGDTSQPLTFDSDRIDAATIDSNVGH